MKIDIKIIIFVFTKKQMPCVPFNIFAKYSTKSFYNITLFFRIWAFFIDFRERYFHGKLKPSRKFNLKTKNTGQLQTRQKIYIRVNFTKLVRHRQLRLVRYHLHEYLIWRWIFVLVNGLHSNWGSLIKVKENSRNLLWNPFKGVHLFDLVTIWTKKGKKSVKSSFSSRSLKVRSTYPPSPPLYAGY